MPVSVSRGLEFFFGGFLPVVLVGFDLEVGEGDVDLVGADFVHCDAEAEFEGFGVGGGWED